MRYKLVKIEYNCHIYRKRHFHEACFPQTFSSISQPSVEISSKFKMYNNPDILEKTGKTTRDFMGSLQMCAEDKTFD